MLLRNVVYETTVGSINATTFQGSSQRCFSRWRHNAKKTLGTSFDRMLASTGTYSPDCFGGQQRRLLLPSPVSIILMLLVAKRPILKIRVLDSMHGCYLRAKLRTEQQPIRDTVELRHQYGIFRVLSSHTAIERRRARQERCLSSLIFYFFFNPLTPAFFLTAI